MLWALLCDYACDQKPTKKVPATHYPDQPSLPTTITMQRPQRSPQAMRHLAPRHSTTDFWKILMFLPERSKSGVELHFC